MVIKPGTILISSNALDDANFKNSVIFITEHNQKGSTGFVINKLFARRFNELEEFKDSISFPMYAGGPVDVAHLFILHQRPGLIEESIPVTGTIYRGGNFKQAVENINALTLTGNDIKLFIGYCGWDENELEAEIKEGSWLVTEADERAVFSPYPELLWQKLYAAANK